MSTLILPLTVKVAGVLKDADELPVLSDSAGAFGVKRHDTGEVIIAAGTPMTRASTGQYSYSLADAIDAVTYDWVGEVKVTGDDGVQRTIYAPQSSTAIPAGTSYLADLAAANLLANARAGLASWKAANAADQAAAAQVASERIDALRWQGRKYDLSQALAFPRVAYETSGSVVTWGTGLLVGNEFPQSGTVIWDWDATNLVAFVPQRVLLACLYEADSILSSTSAAREERLQAIADGINEQGVGRTRESYFDPLRPNAMGLYSLCLRANELMAPYRLRSGRNV